MAKITGVYKDKNGTWYYSFSFGFDPKTGKKNRILKRGFRTQSEAAKARTAALNEIHVHDIKTTANLTYKQFMNDIFIPEYRTQVEITTFNNRLSLFNQMIAEFGRIKLKNITALRIQSWKNELTEKYAQNYARAIFGLFSKTLEKAKSLNMVTTNFATKTGAIKKRKTTVDFWTVDEFQKVLTTFNLADYYNHFCFVMVWLFFMTGLRVNEGAALRWKEDLDFTQKTLTIHHSLRINKKTDWELGPTKTRAGMRTIALDDDTIEVLKVWQQRQLRAIGYEVDFILSYDGFPFIKSTLNRIITRHAELAGVHRIQPKGLRHSHASFLINEFNINALAIKERLGHEDIKTTLSTYSHLYPNVNFQLANQISGTINYTTAENTLTKFNGNQSIKHSDFTEKNK